MSLIPPDVAVKPHQTSSTVCIRTASAADADNLSIYFSSLSKITRNKRFMGARADFAAVAAECVAKVSDPDHFTLLAELRQEQGESEIIGETRYAYDAVAGHGEFAISVADLFQRKGLGLQMITMMEKRAGDLGHEIIAADTARDNSEMRGLARKAGFVDTGFGDWQSVHLAKHLPR